MGKHFLWDPVEDNIVKELDDGGTTIVDYTTEPYLYGDLISQHRSGQSAFYHYDGQGSTTSLTDASGNITDTYAYSAFGEVTSQTGSTVNPFQYIGRNGCYKDPTTTDYWVRRRPYSPRTSRWLSSDPFSTLTDDFVYVGNSPLLFIDPSGTTRLSCLCNWGHPHHLQQTWLDNVNCVGLGISCCKRACRSHNFAPGSIWGWTGQYGGDWAVTDAIDDTGPDPSKQCEGWERFYDFSSCWACCVQSHTAGALIGYVIGDWSDGSDIVVAGVAGARLPKARGLGLKKGFRVDLGTRVGGRYHCPPARTQHILVEMTTKGTGARAAARFASRASVVLVVVEGTIDWAAIGCCCVACSNKDF